MGYEEAQASLATLTAELERAREELASRKKRERMLSQRVEDLLEELQSDKQNRLRDQESYTKEIKRCRKETYRAELAVVEARQDLQDARSDLKKCQAEVMHEKGEKEKARQEAFERAYVLAGTVGELEQVKDRLKVVEKERDAALLDAKAAAVEKTEMIERASQTESRKLQKEADDNASKKMQNDDETVDESTRAVREAIKSQWSHHSHSTSDARPDSSHSTASGNRFRVGRPARPCTTKPLDYASAISRLNYFSKQLEGEKATPAEEIDLLKQELAWAKRKHTEDADLIHLMHMQCQFKACPCRLAESNGDRFVHDEAYDMKSQQQQTSKKRKIAKETHEDRSMVQETRGAKFVQTAPGQDVAMDLTPKAENAAAEESLILPPEPNPRFVTRASDSPLVLEQAIEVPLPEAGAHGAELKQHHARTDGTARGDHTSLG